MFLYAVARAITGFDYYNHHDHYVVFKMVFSDFIFLAPNMSRYITIAISASADGIIMKA